MQQHLCAVGARENTGGHAVAQRNQLYMGVVKGATGRRDMLLRSMAHTQPRRDYCSRLPPAPAPVAF